MLIGWDTGRVQKIASIPGPYITPASYRACFLKLLAYIPYVTGLFERAKNEKEKKSECVAGNVNVFAGDGRDGRGECR